MEEEYRYFRVIDGVSREMIKHGGVRYPDNHPMLKECIGQMLLFETIESTWENDNG